MFQWVAGILPDSPLMRLRVYVALKPIFVLALPATQLAEVFEPRRRHVTLIKGVLLQYMSRQSDEQIRQLRQQLQMGDDQVKHIISDGRRLVERVERLNDAAVLCLIDNKYQTALVYLEEAEILLESAANRGNSIDHSLAQCVLHNQACCFQNAWKLQQCSNYLEALIFNINSRSQPASQVIPSRNSAQRVNSKQSLALYYLQFSAINSQMDNHSGALISAQKALNVLKGEVKWWERWCQSRNKKGDWNQQLRILGLCSSFNDGISIHMHQTLCEATSYFLKAWKSNCSSSKIHDPNVKQLVDSFTIKDVMNIKCMTHSEYLHCDESEVSVPNVYQLVFLLSTAYFTIATQLRLIAIGKGTKEEVSKEQPEFKESEMYHLLAILILAISLTSYSPFLGHLLLSYNNHYHSDLMLKQISYKKIFNEIIFRQQRKPRDPSSIEFNSQEDYLHSQISKPGPNIRVTKSSKGQKQSLIDPKNKAKNKNAQSKNQKKKTESKSKNKNIRTSRSKSRHSKTPKKKDSILLKSPKSKEHIDSNTRIPSIRYLASPVRTKGREPPQKLNSKIKTRSKSKSKPKNQEHNEYFLIKKGDRKKGSVSSKKNKSQSRSTGRLPINSTLETKQLGKDKKKGQKKSLLQHYL